MSRDHLINFFRTGMLTFGSLLSVAACGGSGTVRPTNPAAGSNPGLLSAPTGARSGKTAAQLVRDSAAALRDVRSYTVRGVGTTNGHTLTFGATVRGPDSLKLSYGDGEVAWDAIILGNAGYFRGNSTYWISRVGLRGGKLGNKWLRVEAADIQATRPKFAHLTPASIARCMGVDNGTLSVLGTRQIAGRAAVVIQDEGNAPGTARGLLAIAAAGPPYPLQITTTGDQRPGGRIDACNDGRGASGRGTISLSRLNKVPPIAAPTHVVSIAAALGA